MIYLLMAALAFASYLYGVRVGIQHTKLRAYNRGQQDTLRQVSSW